MNDVLDDLRAAADYQIRMSGSASDYLLEAENEIKRLRAELEVERMRLAACDVVALADTPESAVAARKMLPDYRSASLSSVERRVDEVISLRAEVERLRAEMPVAESLRVNAKCAEIERDEARAVAWNQAKENANLRAEVERLQGLLRSFNRNEAEQVSRRIRERNELLDELERLRAFNINAARETLEAVGRTADDAREEMRAEVEQLIRERDEARYFLAIFAHAHASNNAVPPHIEEQARKALEAKP